MKKELGRKPSSRARLFALTGVLAVSCATAANTASLVNAGIDQKAAARFQFDTGCPQEETTVERLSDSEVGVSGCGRKAVYLEMSTAGPGCHVRAHAEIGNRERISQRIVEACTLVQNSAQSDS
jgi:hypothetical protein